MTLLGALIVSAVLTIGLTSRVRWPRLVVEEFPSQTRRAAAYALLAITLGVTVVLPLSRFGTEAPAMTLRDVSLPELLAGHALLVGFLAAWWALSGFRPPLRFLHVRLVNPVQQLRQGVAVGIAGWAITMLTMAIAGTLVGLADGVAPVAGDDEVPEVVRAIVALSVADRLALVCSAGIVEEAFFRAFLQSRSGLVLSTLLFTASHSSYGLPLMLVGVFAVSLVLGWLFHRRDDVVPCMIAHGVFDAIQLFVVLPAVVGNGAAVPA